MLSQSRIRAQPMRNKPTHSRRVLVADDDADVRSTLRLILEMQHYEVVEACDGLEALDLSTSHHFHLVITDYLMPGMSGDVLALELKKQAPSRPVIMITANADSVPDPISGVDRVLAKPFQVKDLLKALDEVSAGPPSSPSRGG